MNKLIPKFFGKVVNGKVVRNRQALYDAYIKGLEGKDVEEVLQLEQKDKTLPQTGYFFGVVCAVAIAEGDKTRPGNTTAEVYEWLQGKVWKRHPRTFIAPDGTEIPKAYNISKMNREQLAWFIDECSMVIFETLEIIVPEPTQVYWEQ